MSTNFDNFYEKLNSEYENIKSTIKKPNILIIGATGVGKSSLINTVFGKELAKVGSGQPVTKEITAYRSENVPVVLYDTKGYEIGTEEQDRFLKEVVSYTINSNNKNTDEKIHMVWYCIQASGHRILDVDTNVLNQLHETGIPVAVILTKCDLVTQEEVDKLKDILSKDAKRIPSFLITTEDIPAIGTLELNDLIIWSLDKLPEGLKLAFLSAQKINLEEKKKAAKKTIIQHTSGAGLIGMSPIPFADAPFLLANQAGMFARVMFIYDMPDMLKHVQTLVGSLGLGSLISNSGIWLVGQILKIVPVIGTAAGAVVSGTVASAITAAIGFAISEVCYKMSLYLLDGDTEGLKTFMNGMGKYFEDLVKNNFKKKPEWEKEKW